MKVIFPSHIMLTDFTIFFKVTFIHFYEAKTSRMYTVVTVRIYFL